MAENEPTVLEHSSDPRLSEFLYQDRRMSFCSKAGIALGILATGSIVAGAVVLVAGGSPELGWSLVGDGAILGAGALNESRHYLQAGSAIDNLYHSPTV
jgi:hypothetical protein